MDVLARAEHLILSTLITYESLHSPLLIVNRCCSDKDGVSISGQHGWLSIEFAGHSFPETENLLFLFFCFIPFSFSCYLLHFLFHKT